MNTTLHLRCFLAQGGFPLPTYQFSLLELQQIMLKNHKIRKKIKGLTPVLIFGSP